MRLSLLSLSFVLVVSCSPRPAPEPKKPVTAATLPVRAQHYPGNSAPLPNENESPTNTSAHALQFQTAPLAGATLSYLTFDSRTHTLEVVDQPGLGATYQSSAQVTTATKALATINGGFFTPEGKPLGVLYHKGRKTGSLNTASSLGSGVFYVDQTIREPVIARRAVFQQNLRNSSFTPLEALSPSSWPPSSSRCRLQPS